LDLIQDQERPFSFANFSQTGQEIIRWYVNPTFTRLTGYTLEEAKGKNPRILKSGNMPREEYKRLWDTIQAGKEWRGEFLNRKKNGEEYWEYAVIAPLMDASGNITNFIAIKEDISERKRVEEELASSKARADLYLDLMGHDIRNMNMIASTFLEMAMETLEATGRLDRSEAHMLEKPLESLRSSTNLIAAVQKLQRSLTGEKKLEKTDVTKAIRSTVEEFSHVPGRDVRISVSGEGECFVMADDLLRDVFANLIGNAIKHSSPDRPLTVKICLRQAVVYGKKLVLHDHRGRRAGHT
jgi:PAS domain S-box-containing protein